MNRIKEMLNPTTQDNRTQMVEPKECNFNDPLLLQCADLILPYLTPPELANISITCKSLFNISTSITLLRISDASRTFENLPIPFLNPTLDHHPYSYFLYTPSLTLASNLQRQFWGGTSVISRPSRPVLEPVSVVDEFGRKVWGCVCEDCGGSGSGLGSECGCLGLDGLGELGSECGPGCLCGPECVNRFTQNGVAVRLKIVRDRRKGWCLYADQFIRKGQFLFEYAGELLTTKEAQRRHQHYDELRSHGCFSSALLVVREHLPSGKACLRLNIDATRIGNVARFVNHSCDGGNLSTKLVRSSGVLLPRLCFYALKDIQEDEELTFSYGEIRKRADGLPCFCNSSSCFGILPSEDT